MNECFNMLVWDEKKKKKNETKLKIKKEKQKEWEDLSEINLWEEECCRPKFAFKVRRKIKVLGLWLESKSTLKVRRKEK